MNAQPKSESEKQRENSTRRVEATQNPPSNAPMEPTPPSELSPTDSLSLVRQRRHQNFFRRIVLHTYNQSCCITGNPIPELLRASHIVPWSQSVSHRLNPRNGLCLSATFDAAFDRGLIGFDDAGFLLIGNRIKEHRDNIEIKKEFIDREGQPLRLPEKNLPDEDLLRWHRENVYEFLE